MKMSCFAFIDFKYLLIMIKRNCMSIFFSRLIVIIKYFTRERSKNKIKRIVNIYYEKLLSNLLRD